MKKKTKYYAVTIGRNPGIYETWDGEDGAKAQVAGFPDAKYKGFSTIIDAKAWLSGNDNVLPQKQSPRKQSELESPEEGKVIIYTDGGCLNNPGPGGYGAVLLYGDKRKELSGGFRKTTNNRMELTACIEGLKALKFPCSVILTSDSRYLVNGITKGWAERWKKNGWMRNIHDPAINADLWAQLLELCKIHTVEFRWVKGHAGNTENERCDQLANLAMADKNNLIPDEGYEIGLPDEKK